MFFKKISFIFLFILLSKAHAKSLAETVELPIPPSEQAVMTVERRIGGLLPTSSEVYLFLGKSDHFTRVPIHLAEKSRDTRFGKLIDQVRTPIPGVELPGDWRGGYLTDKRFYVFDGASLQLANLRRDDWKLVEVRSVPADLLKPAADAQGEATTFETKKLREKFKKASKKVFGSAYMGLAEVPENWQKSTTRDFLIATNIPGFPLLLMGCDKNDPSVCMITRQCYLEGLAQDQQLKWAGVAVDEKSKSVLLAETTTNSIYEFQFRSCFDIPLKRRFQLPKRLPKISNLSVDRERRLWISTVQVDPFTDSNLVFWEFDQWNKGQAR